MGKIFLAVAIASLFAACQQASPPVNPKPLVWVSVAPYQQLAQRLAGPDIEVESIVPQQADPHSFEPTSRQVTHMERGRLWFCIGEAFEKKLLPLLQERNPDLLTVDLRNTVHLISDEGLSCRHCSMDHQDRHIWMSPRDTQNQVIEMARALQTAFPEKAEEIDVNLASLLKDLTALDTQIRTLIDGSGHRTILVSHPAFGYFCREYACKQLSIEYEGKDPRPRQIEEILLQAAASHTEVAIALPQYNNKGAQLIAQKLHIPIRMVDPYSADYFAMLLSLAEIISQTQNGPSL